MSSENTIKEGILKCSNITVGDVTYQMFCVSNQNTAGSCSTLPPMYTQVNCTNVTSTAFLQEYLKSTGNACGVNCYSLPLNGTFTNATSSASYTPSASITHTNASQNSLHADPLVLFIFVFSVLAYLFFNSTRNF